MDQRRIDLANWARHQLMDLLADPGLEVALQVLSGDASFRRYFRAELPHRSFVLVDAPPDREDSRPFARIAGSFAAAGLRTPQVLRSDFELGFMLLEDFGDRLYLPALQQAKAEHGQADQLYRAAIDTLITLQSRHGLQTLPAYDRALLNREMQLFEDWFCRRFLQLDLSAAEQRLLSGTLQKLEDAALAQTRVAVHRDYHSRNLMIIGTLDHVAGSGPGVLDFQDAVAGPYTYDLVSLLRDCYIRWPSDYVRQLASHYRKQAMLAGIIGNVDEAVFRRDFDLMGLQRHLKVIGIFARLSLRDGKSRYLDDIPLVIDYFLDVAVAHPEFSSFLQWFRERVLPAAREKLPAGVQCAP